MSCIWPTHLFSLDGREIFFQELQATLAEQFNIIARKAFEGRRIEFDAVIHKIRRRLPDSNARTTSGIRLAMEAFDMMSGLTPPLTRAGGGRFGRSRRRVQRLVTRQNFCLRQALVVQTDSPEKKIELASQKLTPLAGYAASAFPPITEGDYIALVNWTGRQWHPGKRGKISDQEPAALQRLGLDPNHWTTKVKGIGSTCWRVIGTVEEMLDKAKTLKQRCVRGISFARMLERKLG